MAAFGRPITGTSANLSGREGCHDIEELDPLLLVKLDIVLDAGPLRQGIGSTVVDISGDDLVVLREGVVSQAAILAAVR